MYYKEANWPPLAQGMVQEQCLVNTVKNFMLAWKA